MILLINTEDDINQFLNYFKIKFKNGYPFDENDDVEYISFKESLIIKYKYYKYIILNDCPQV